MGGALLILAALIAAGKKDAQICLLIAGINWLR